MRQGATVGATAMDEATDCQTYTNFSAPPRSHDEYWRFILNFNPNLQACIEVWDLNSNPAQVVRYYDSQRITCVGTSVVTTTVQGPPVMPPIPALSKEVYQASLTNGGYIQCNLDLRAILDDARKRFQMDALTGDAETVITSTYYSMSAIVNMRDPAVLYSGRLLQVEPSDGSCISTLGPDSPICKPTQWSVASSVTSTNGSDHLFVTSFNRGDPITTAGGPFTSTLPQFEAWWVGLHQQVRYDLDASGGSLTPTVLSLVSHRRDLARLTQPIFATREQHDTLSFACVAQYDGIHHCGLKDTDSLGQYFAGLWRGPLTITIGDPSGSAPTLNQIIIDPSSPGMPDS